MTPLPIAPQSPAKLSQTLPAHDLHFHDGALVGDGIFLCEAGGDSHQRFFSQAGEVG